MRKRPCLSVRIAYRAPPPVREKPMSGARAAGGGPAGPPTASSRPVIVPVWVTAATDARAAWVRRAQKNDAGDRESDEQGCECDQSWGVVDGAAPGIRPSCCLDNAREVKVPGGSAIRAGPDDAGLIREDDGLDPVSEREFREHAGDMGLDRRARDDELIGDLGVREAAGDEREDLVLARRELVELRGSRRSRVVANERFDQAPGDGWRQQRIPRRPRCGSPPRAARAGRP